MEKIFLVIISFLLLAVSSWLLVVGTALAADYALEVPFTQETITGPASYIYYLFVWGLGMVGIMALAAIAYGGFVYLGSGGSETTKSYAKEIIWGAIGGILLLFCSYLILHTINPDLVKLKEPILPPISIEKPPEEPEEGPDYTKFSYATMTQEACADMGGSVVEPCQTYCPVSAGLCNQTVICCAVPK